MSRLGWFVFGIVFAIIVIAGGGFLFVRSGGVSVDTTAPPLPLERTIAQMAIHASFGNAAEQKDPLPPSEGNMLAGARQYRQHCAVCHGAPGQPPTAISKGMFPRPPRLFDKDEMVTDDPEGVTHWKVTHGIRLSGMPGFASTLSDTERWQVTMLVTNADKLTPAVQAAVSR
jgi:mono/diheme cytochrome c family protein